MRSAPRPGPVEFDNQAQPPAAVTVTIRRAFGGMVTQATWQCRGCLDGDDQAQAPKWARQDAAAHADRCTARPWRPREA